MSDLYSLPKDLLVKLIVHINDIDRLTDAELREKAKQFNDAINKREDRKVTLFVRKNLMTLLNHEEEHIRNFIEKYQEQIKNLNVSISGIERDELNFSLNNKTCYLYIQEWENTADIDERFLCGLYRLKIGYQSLQEYLCMEYYYYYSYSEDDVITQN